MASKSKKSKVKYGKAGSPSRKQYKPIRSKSPFPFKSRGKKKPKGWEGEPERHRMSRYGIETTPPDFGQVYDKAPEFFSGPLFASGHVMVRDVYGAGMEAGLTGPELEAFVDEYGRWGYSNKTYDMLGAARMYREEGRIEHGLPYKASGMTYEQRIRRAGVKAGLTGSKLDDYIEAYTFYGYSDSPHNMRDAAMMFIEEGHVEGQPMEE